MKKRLLFTLALVTIIVFSSTALLAAKEFRVFKPRGKITVGDKVTITFVNSKLNGKKNVLVQAGLKGQPGLIYNRTFNKYFKKRLNINWVAKKDGNFKFFIRFTNSRNRKLIFQDEIRIKILPAKGGTTPGQPGGTQGKPDLQIRSINYTPATIIQGQPVTFNIVVENKGKAPAAGVAPGNIIPVALDDGIKTLCAKNIPGPIPAGASVNVPCQATLASAGAFQLEAAVDKNAQIPDADRSNNKKRISVKVSAGQGPGTNTQGYPDLLVQIRTADIRKNEFDAGEKFQLKVKVENRGIVPTPTGQKIQFVLKNGADVLNNHEIPTVLMPNSSSDFNLTVTKSLPVGENTLTIKVDPSDNIKELNEGNNEASVKIKIKQPQLAGSGYKVLDPGGFKATEAKYPDLAIIRAELQPSTVEEGKPSTVYFKVQNKGKADIKVPVESKVAANGALVCSLKFTLPVPVGGTFDHRCDFTPKTEGTYTIKIEVDPDRKIYEMDGANNRKTLYLKAKKKQSGNEIIVGGNPSMPQYQLQNQPKNYLLGDAPDLVVKSIDLNPEYPSFGKPFKIIVTVKNKGGAIAANYPFWLELSVDKRFPPFQQIRGLDAGAEKKLTFDVPAGLPKKQIELIAFVDNKKQIKEKNENNNTMKTSFMYDVQSADIVMEDWYLLLNGKKTDRFDEFVFDSTKVDLVVKFKNKGKAPFTGSMAVGWPVNSASSSLTSSLMDYVDIKDMKPGDSARSYTLKNFQLGRFLVKGTEKQSVKIQYEVFKGGKPKVMSPERAFTLFKPKPKGDLSPHFPLFAIEGEAAMFYNVKCAPKTIDVNTFIIVNGTINMPVKYKVSWLKKTGSSSQWASRTYTLNNPKPGKNVIKFTVDGATHTDDPAKYPRHNLKVCYQVDPDNSILETNEKNNKECYVFAYGTKANECEEARKMYSVRATKE